MIAGVSIIETRWTLSCTRMALKDRHYKTSYRKTEFHTQLFVRQYPEQRQVHIFILAGRRIVIDS